MTSGGERAAAGGGWRWPTPCLVRSAGAALLGSAALLAGACSAPANYTIVQSQLIQAPAAHLREKVAKPLWTAPLTGDYVRSIAFISDSTVLVSQGEYSDFGIPASKAVTAVDARSGRVLWTLGERAEVAAPTPRPWVRALVSETARLWQVDPTSGKILVELPVRNGYDLLFDRSGDTLAVVNQDEDGREVLVHSVADGKLIWKAPLKRPAFAAWLSGKTVLAAGEKLELRTAAASHDVALPFKVSGAWPAGPSAFYVVGEQEGSGGMAKVSSNGAVTWTRSKPKGTITPLTHAGTEVLLLEEEWVDTKARGVLLSLDDTTGKVRWKADLGGFAASLPFAVEAPAPSDPPAPPPPEPPRPAPKKGAKKAAPPEPAPPPPPPPAAAQPLLLITVTSQSDQPDRLVALDAATGARQFALDLPGARPPKRSLPARKLLPDRVARFGDRIVIVRATGIAELDLSARQLRGATPFRGTHFASTLPHGVAPVAADAAARAAASHQAASTSLMAAAQALSSTSVNTGPGGAPATQMQAQQTYAAGVGAAGLGINALVSQAAANALAAAAAKTNAWAVRAELRMKLTLAAHEQLAAQSTITRSLYWTFGRGLLVWNVERGTWAELVTGPPEHLFADYLIQPAPAAIAPKQDLVVTTLTPFDEKQRTTFDCTEFFTGIRHVLAAFALPREGLRPQDQYLASSIVPEGTDVDRSGIFYLFDRAPGAPALVK